MCEYCDYYHSSNGGVSGKLIKIKKCANKTNLTDCQIHKCGTDDNFGIIVFDCGVAKGYFDIDFCPKCGKKLSERKLEPDNNWMDRLESYCEKYGVQFHGRPLDICLFMELLDKMENKPNE